MAAHVGHNFRIEQTDADVMECFRLELAGEVFLLHAASVKELADALAAAHAEWLERARREFPGFEAFT